MTMQYDVQSKHLTSSGAAISFATRLKNITVTSGTASARNIALVDSTGAITGTWDRPAGTPGPITTTVTTATNHGLTTGDRVAIDFLFLEIDTFTTVGLPILIPGEGIRCPNGIYVVLGSSVTATIYYG
jgi:hypothetical protein